MDRSTQGSSKVDKRLTEYGRQLLEKQRLRAYYGVMENQFARYVKKAKKSEEQTGHVLVKTLETRLDNIVYRLGLASSIREARQMVVHGHINVNGININIPSHLLNIGDTISLKEKSQNVKLYMENFENVSSNEFPYLDKDQKNISGTLIRCPEREEVPIEIDDQLIVEYYSR